MPKRPIVDRINDALANGKMSYADLAVEVFPRDEYPWAFYYSSNGGPPGCYMALSAALNRHGFTTFIKGAGGGQRIVYPKKVE